MKMVFKSLRELESYIEVFGQQARVLEVAQQVKAWKEKQAG